MKIIQLSDIHISKKNLYGISPNDRFKKAIQHVLDKHSDSDYLVISGDLTDTGDVDSYNELKNILTSLPDHLSPHLLIGNHDERENFRTVFDSTKTDDNGYIQYVINSSVGDLIMLDTNLKGKHFGHFCDKRQKWLKEQLSSAKELKKDAYVFMHHNFLELDGFGLTDIDLVQKEEFKEILSIYRDTIKYVFFGHCHLNLSGIFSGIPFNASNSTSHPSVPNFIKSGECAVSPEISPNYNVITVNNDNITINTENFLIKNFSWTT